MMTTITKPVYLEEKLEEISSSGRLNYRSKALPTWCPGCGYYAIVEAITTAFNNLGFAALVFAVLPPPCACWIILSKPSPSVGRISLK